MTTPVLRQIPALLLTTAAIVVTAFFTPLALAQQQPQPDRTWHFTLPTLDGDRFVASREQAGLVLVNFWGVDCPPCLAELPLLQKLADASGHWRVLLIATDPPYRARAMLQRLHVTLPTLRGGQGVANLMRAAGDARNVLPYTVALNQGSACASHAGMVNAAIIEQMRAQCASIRTSHTSEPPPSGN